MFQTVPLSTNRSFSLYTQQWYMSYKFANSLPFILMHIWLAVSCFSLHILLYRIATLVLYSIFCAHILICSLCLFWIDEFDVQVTVHRDKFL